MIESINLNLIPSGVSPVCHVSQYDEGRQIKINLFEGINPYTIQSGDSFTLNVRKPDNTIVTTSVSGTQGNNYITISTTEQIAAVVGENLCELKITNGSTVIGTLNFIMLVERDVLADGIPSQSVIEDLDERIAEAIGDNYYNKTETDALLALKADKSELYNVYPTDQESGSIAHFTDGADNIPVKALVSQIVAVETGSGEKSPDNPYSISGFDNGVVSVCGVNLWNEQWELGLYSSATGEPVSSSSYIRSKSTNYVRVEPNITIYAKSPKTLRLLFYDKSYNFVSFIDALNQNVTIPNNVYYVRFSVYDSSYGTTYNNDISINYPSTDTDYHAYNGNTYTFAFGQTVYGGYFDNKGNLVVTHKATTIDDLSFSYESGNTRFVTSISDLKPVGVRRTPFLTSTFYSVDDGRAIADVPDNSIYSSNTTTVYIKCLTYTDPVAFKTALTGAKIVYPIEPITLAITSQDIPTLLGENNIYSDTGDVDVTIRADIGLYIDKRLNANRSTPNNLSRAAAYVEDPESVNETQEHNVEPQNEER